MGGAAILVIEVSGAIYHMYRLRRSKLRPGGVIREILYQLDIGYWGKTSPTSARGASFHLLIIGPSSRHISVFPLAQKSGVYTAMSGLLAYINRT